jgi:hypothetical protein
VKFQLALQWHRRVLSIGEVESCVLNMRSSDRVLHALFSMLMKRVQNALCLNPSALQHH